MKYEIPKTFMGKPVAGSLERVLASLNGNPQNPLQTQNNLPPTNIDLSKYIAKMVCLLKCALPLHFLESNLNPL